MTPIRHLFWDFDGTLYDSYPQVAQSFLRGLGALGVKDLPETDALMKELKVSVYHACCVYGEKLGLEPHAIMESYRSFHTKENVFPPYQGLEQCLRTLHEAGFRHYLYTHRDHKAIDQLEKDGLWTLFDDAVLRTDGYPDKPAPDALLALMERNRLLPECCAMIGDRDIDLEAGHNAGMIGILFDPDGYFDGYPTEMAVKSMQELSLQLLSE